MKYPQEFSQTFFKNACLAFCYLYCSKHTNLTDIEATQIVFNALKNGLLEDNGTVKDASSLLHFYDGGDYTVEKVEINSIENIIKPTPVRFDAYGYTPHWVVVANGKVVFNPLLNSNSVNKGRPVTARLIIRK